MFNFLKRKKKEEWVQFTVWGDNRRSSPYQDDDVQYLGDVRVTYDPTKPDWYYKQEALRLAKEILVDHTVDYVEWTGMVTFNGKKKPLIN